MKKIKIITVVVLLIATLFTLVACKTEAKTFTKDEFSITMTNKYKNVKSNAFMFLKTSNTAFAVIAESEAELVKQNVHTLDEYATLIQTKNSTDKFESYQENGRDIRYVYYTRKNDKDKNYFFMAVLLKGANVYYLGNFSCLESKKDEYKDVFLEYAKTISITVAA